MLSIIANANIVIYKKKHKGIKQRNIWYMDDSFESSYSMLLGSKPNKIGSIQRFCVGCKQILVATYFSVAIH